MDAVIEIELNKADVEEFVGEENAERYMEELQSRLEAKGYTVEIGWTTGYDKYLINGERDDDGIVATVLDQMGNSLNDWL